ncbi:MAG TPA: hypothetical protein VMT15_21930 [Bryobacteraceae bacterium]|nr:hypothetical protein [Bryobacteraceae bacterium]
MKNVRCVTFLFFLSVGPCSLSPAQAPEFISLESARPVLHAMGSSLPPELKAGGAVDEDRWNRWVRAQDQVIRERVKQGEELTLANLLRLGISYTKEPRIEFASLGRYGHDPAIDASVEQRASDLIRALSGNPASEGRIEMLSLLRPVDMNVVLQVPAAH